MCYLCDGGTYDELLFDQYGKILKYGFTTVMIESPPLWAYTIGLVESFGHPELTVAGLPSCCSYSIIDPLTERIRDGERFDTLSPPLTLEWGTVRFADVHAAQWEKGRFNGWLNYYGALDHELPDPDVLQVVWADTAGRFPDHPDFDGEQALFDTVPRHDVNIGMNREQRRRAKYGHGKRKRR